MGIRDLPAYLRGHKPAFFEEKADYTFERNKAYALDLSVLLHDIFAFYLFGQILALVTGDDDARAAAESVIAQHAVDIVSSILAHGVSLVVVVEPVRLPDNHPKAREQKERQRTRGEALASALLAIEDKDETGAIRYAKQAAQRTESMQERCTEAITQLEGVAVIRCRGEADAMLAELEHKNIVHASITKDTDHLMYGGKMVTVRHWGKLSLSWSALNMARPLLAVVAAMCVSDYSKGVDKVGPKRAFAFVEGNAGADLSRAAREKYGRRVPPEFERVVGTFHKPPMELAAAATARLSGLQPAAYVDAIVEKLAAGRADFKKRAEPWYDPNVSQPLAEFILQRKSIRDKDRQQVQLMNTVYARSYTPLKDNWLQARLRNNGKKPRRRKDRNNKHRNSLRRSRLGMTLTVRVTSPQAVEVTYQRYGESEEHALRRLRPPANTFFREAPPRINSSYVLLPVMRERAGPFEGVDDFLAWRWTVHRPQSDNSRVILRAAFRDASSRIPRMWLRDRSIDVESKVSKAGYGHTTTAPPIRLYNPFALLATLGHYRVEYTSKGAPKPVSAKQRREAYPNRAKRRGDTDAGSEAKRARTTVESKAGQKRKAPAKKDGRTAKRARTSKKRDAPAEMTAREFYAECTRRRGTPQLGHFVRESLANKPSAWVNKALEAFGLAPKVASKLGFADTAGKVEVLTRLALERQHRGSDFDLKPLLKKKVILGRLYQDAPDQKPRFPAELDESQVDRFLRLEDARLRQPLPFVVGYYVHEADKELKAFLKQRYTRLASDDAATVTDEVKKLSSFERFLLKHGNSSSGNSASDDDVGAIVRELCGTGMDTSVGGGRFYRVDEGRADAVAREFYSDYVRGYEDTARVIDSFRMCAMDWLDEQPAGAALPTTIPVKVREDFHTTNQPTRKVEMRPLRALQNNTQLDAGTSRERVLAIWLQGVAKYEFSRFRSCVSEAGAQQAEANMRSAVTNFIKGHHSKLGYPPLKLPHTYECGPWCVEVPLAAGVKSKAGKKLREAVVAPPGGRTPVYKNAIKLMRTAAGKLVVRVLDSGKCRSPPVEPGSRLQLSDVASIDPGVRSFGTLVTGDGRVVELHDPSVARRMRRLNDEAARLRALRVKLTERAEFFRKRELEVGAKLARVRKRFHYSVANYLLRNYRRILLPKFSVSGMVRRKGRVFGKGSTKSVLNFGHYQFRELLLQLARLCPGVEVIVCDEPWTSKTCAACGELRKDLGGSKTFTCRSCRHTCDRDVNGAINILVRYATLWWKGYQPGRAPSRFLEQEGTSHEGEDPSIHMHRAPTDIKPGSST